MFDNIGTLIGVTRKANLVNEEGKFEGLNRALLCTSIGAAAGAVVGTSTVTSYIESAAAVADGGRRSYGSSNWPFILGIFILCTIVLIGTGTSDCTCTDYYWRIYDE